MKKLLLLSAVCAIASIDASAQSTVGSATGVSTNSQKASKMAISNGLETISLPPVVGGTPSGKTTVGGSRWYSYAGYVDLITPLDDSTVFPYLWHKSNAKAIYSAAGGGVVADTIQLSSYGITIDPVFKSTISGSTTTLEGYNEISAFDKTSIVIRRTNDYTVDSVRVMGIYGRNNLKTTSIDTMRITVVYGLGTGTEMPVFQFSGPKTGFPFTSFGYDTVRFAGMRYDKVNNMAKGVTGTSRIIKDIYLSKTDTSLSFLKEFKAAVGLNVPKGNVVGVSATFISGENFVPFVDTIYFGTLRPANPYNFGMVRPRIFSQPAAPGTLSQPGFPQYHPGYYNTGFVKILPESTSWDTLYVPSYAYTAPFQYEIPDIDVKLSCATCNTIQELAIQESSIFANVNAFPNPANTELNIPFALKEKANVTVNITNMVGQVVATQNIGSVNAGQSYKATFNTSNLVPGVYLYTVEANGQRSSNRFTIAH